jgi:hypothetical protein
LTLDVVLAPTIEQRAVEVRLIDDKKRKMLEVQRVLQQNGYSGFRFG